MDKDSLLDVISVLSFIIGVLNLDENVSQTSIDKTVSEAVLEIHKHLSYQDSRIDRILSILSPEDKYEQRD